jgi:malonyl CoA-acyl carrier protein transacylase
MADSQRQTAALFPGQGSQTEGMRATVDAVRPDLAALATELAGADPFEHADDSTRYAQPAIYCASIAAWEAHPVEEATYMAGHSLGEITALVAARALSPEDGLRLVALRGRLMDEAATEGTMLALVGAGSAEQADDIASESGTWVANHNGPAQVVLSGRPVDLENAASLAADRGVRAIPLPVSGAFHSPLMEPAVEPFAAALDYTDFREPRVPVISCVTAEPFDDIRRRLAEALTSPVRWSDVVQTLATGGVHRFVEVGPGKVLTGLVKRNVRGVEAITLDREPAHV